MARRQIAWGRVRHTAYQLCVRGGCQQSWRFARGRSSRPAVTHAKAERPPTSSSGERPVAEAAGIVTA